TTDIPAPFVTPFSRLSSLLKECHEATGNTENVTRTLPVIGTVLPLAAGRHMSKSSGLPNELASPLMREVFRRNSGSTGCTGTSLILIFIPAHRKYLNIRPSDRLSLSTRLLTLLKSRRSHRTHLITVPDWNVSCAAALGGIGTRIGAGTSSILP